ncbi:MAG: ATP phosphoribosyltransferase regulatory subunit [Eubacteriales bacterium]
MKKRQNNIPEGTRDLIFDETVYINSLVQSFTGVYERLGFNQIMTPTLEYYDLFDTEGQLPQESMYKLFDGSSRILVLRPDNTTPMARVAASKLRGVSLPLNIYYNQSVYRINGDYSGRQREQLQSGIEIIGLDGINSTVACISTALEILKVTGLSFKLEIGHIGYYKAVVKSLQLDGESEEQVKDYISAKNDASQGLDKLGLTKRQSEVISSFPTLFGGYEVIEKARELAGDNSEAQSCLDEVYTLYSAFQQAGYGDNILIDLGIIHNLDYYTGCVFRGYVEGAGEHVLSGGRYDNLIGGFGMDCPAAGFGVNVNKIAEGCENVLGRRHKSAPDVLIHFDAPSDYPYALALQNKLSGTILNTGFPSLEKAMEFAGKRHIPRVEHVKDGQSTTYYIK